MVSKGEFVFKSIKILTPYFCPFWWIWEASDWLDPHLSQSLPKKIFDEFCGPYIHLGENIYLLCNLTFNLTHTSIILIFQQYKYMDVEKNSS